MCFQSGYSQDVIELCVLQFWSEIILVISNQNHAVHLLDFEITGMISDYLNCIPPSSSTIVNSSISKIHLAILPTECLSFPCE